MLQAASFGYRAKVLSEIAAIVGLVIVLREQFEHPVVSGFIPYLQGVQNDKAAAGFQQACELAEHDTTRFCRQFMEHEEARHSILAFIVERNGFAIRYN